MAVSFLNFSPLTLDTSPMYFHSTCYISKTIAASAGANITEVNISNLGIIRGYSILQPQPSLLPLVMAYYMLVTHMHSSQALALKCERKIVSCNAPSEFSDSSDLPNLLSTPLPFFASVGLERE
jgi:hypothetical protein